MKYSKSKYGENNVYKVSESHIYIYLLRKGTYLYEAGASLLRLFFKEKSDQGEVN